MTIEGMQTLAYAVLEQAVKDYKKAHSKYSEEAIERFMNNNLFCDILDINGQSIVEELKKYRVRESSSGEKAA